MLYDLFRKFSRLINDIHKLTKTKIERDEGFGILFWQAEAMDIGEKGKIKIKGNTDDLRATNFSAKGTFVGFAFQKTMKFFYMALFSMRYRWFGEQDQLASGIYRKAIKEAFKSEFGEDL